MASYATFFLCEPARLEGGFPGWKPPLPVPATRTSINPFTGEEMTVTSRVPEWSDADVVAVPEYGVVNIQGDYQTYLEQRIPPFVASLPHWCAKNITSVELAPLVTAVCQRNVEELEIPLYAHPSIAAGIERFPEDFASKLASAGQSGLEGLAKQWAAAMSTPELTHSVSGVRLQDDWSIDDAFELLQPIQQLATRAGQAENLLLLTEA